MRFIKSFNWRPPLKRTCHIAYKEGMVLFVTRDCGKEAIAKGKAQACARPFDVG